MIDKEKLLARRKKNKEQNDDKTLKRVYCLYRVSNKNQVDDDDIPMQKKACHEFVQSQFGWVIKKEIEEKGVSGFSVSADDRDAIVQLKDAAAQHEFDVLLVFMFDRLGRREDESPFVLKWFVEQGIKVWSVKEGQQSFDKHEDDLINYIRFWAANAESSKTSQRVATRLRQMVEDGLFIGGTLPFGYKWIDTGNINKKGSMIRKPEIISEEAEIVRCIFHKTVNDGMKPVSLANQINEKGIKTHTGTGFTSSLIIRILKNPLYCGFYVRGQVVSPRHTDLQIIDDDLYNEAQLILRQRSEQYKESHISNISQVNGSVLSDLVYCSSCSKKLIYTTTSGSRKTADGSTQHYVYGRFICAGSALNRYACSGQGTYSSNKLEKIVNAYLYKCFKSMKSENQITKLEEKHRKREYVLQKRIRVMKYDLEKENEEYDNLIMLIPKSLMNPAEYSAEDISKRLSVVKKKIEKQTKKLEELNEQRIIQTRSKKTIRQRYEKLKSMAEQFDAEDVNRNKSIVLDLIEKIYAGKGTGSKYDVQVQLNEDYSELISF